MGVEYVSLYKPCSTSPSKPCVDDSRRCLLRRCKNVSVGRVLDGHHDVHDVHDVFLCRTPTPWIRRVSEYYAGIRVRLVVYAGTTSPTKPCVDDSRRCLPRRCKNESVGRVLDSHHDVHDVHDVFWLIIAWFAVAPALVAVSPASLRQKTCTYLFVFKVLRHVFHTRWAPLSPYGFLVFIGGGCNQLPNTWTPGWL